MGEKAGVPGRERQNVVIGASTASERMVDGLPAAIAVEMTTIRPQMVVGIRSGAAGAAGGEVRFPPQRMEDLALPDVIDVHICFFRSVMLSEQIVVAWTRCLSIPA